MHTPSLRRSLRWRRRIVVVAAHAWRLLRTHYFSLLSAGILAGALGVVLTSSSFRLDEAASRPLEDVAVEAAGPETPIATPHPFDAASPTERWLVYYLFDAPEQRRLLENAMRSDAVYLLQQNLPAPLITVYFMEVNNATDEAEAAHVLREIRRVADIEGYNLRIIDLR